VFQSKSEEKYYLFRYLRYMQLFLEYQWIFFVAQILQIAKW